MFKTYLVQVFSGNYLIDELFFNDELKAETAASTFQDDGFKVRLIEEEKELAHA